MVICYQNVISIIATSYRFLFVGSLLVFKDKMQLAKKFIRPSGYKYRCEMIEILELSDKSYCRGDLPAVLKFYRRSLKLARKLAPHFKSKSMMCCANLIADECEKTIKETKSNGIGFRKFHDLSKLAMARINDEL